MSALVDRLHEAADDEELSIGAAWALLEKAAEALVQAERERDEALKRAEAAEAWAREQAMEEREQRARAEAAERELCSARFWRTDLERAKAVLRECQNWVDHTLDCPYRHDNFGDPCACGLEHVLDNINAILKD